MVQDGTCISCDGFGVVNDYLVEGENRFFVGVKTCDVCDGLGTVST